MGHRRVIVLTVIALLAGLSGYYISGRLFGQTGQLASTPSESVIGAPRPDYQLGDSNGEFVSANEFDGQVVLVNFWATWCKPCREEMPMLSSLQHDYMGRGLQIVGIALDDVQSAREFALEIGVQYPILVGSTDVMVTVHQYGNRTGTLPYSVLIDRQGIIRWSHLGVLERDMLVEKIAEFL